MRGAGVVVIGAGVAGTAAALAAARAQARVTLLDGGTGASTLWTGRVSAAAEPSAAARWIAEQLGVRLGRALLATATGLAPAAEGHDAALLNLHGAADAAVGVVRADRPGWDAGALAQAAGARFVALEAAILRHVDERHAPDADFAARHDDAERLAWLAGRLRDALARAGARVGALLVPPSLGVVVERATEISKMLGVPCGEAMALPGGPAGLRLEQARDRALAAAGVSVVRRRASAIEGAGNAWRVVLADDGGERLEAGAVVVATGGLVGGGIEYQPSEAMEASVLPPQARPPFRATLEGPLPLGAHGRALETPGSLFGVPPEDVAWPLAREALMERVGVLCAGDGGVAPGLHVAGEVVADAPRTWMQAVESGARAGAAAAAREASAASAGVAGSASEATADR